MNSTFSLSQSLPPLEITKDFLIALEKYLIKRVTDRLEITDEEAKAALTVRIEDHMGTEKFKTIEQMTSPRFSNSTNLIQIVFDSSYRKDGLSLRIRVNFSKSWVFSNMSIDATMLNAKEVVLGLSEGIKRELEQQHTWHWLVYPSTIVIVFSMIVILVTGYWTYQAFINEIHHYKYSFPLLMMTCTYNLLSWIIPYNVFESRISERNKKIWSWGVGTFGAFLFGTILVSVRDNILQ